MLFALLMLSDFITGRLVGVLSPDVVLQNVFAVKAASTDLAGEGANVFASQAVTLEGGKVHEAFAALVALARPSYTVNVAHVLEEGQLVVKGQVAVLAAAGCFSTTFIPTAASVQLRSLIRLMH